MANPFDQFDAAPVASKVTVSPASNPFDQFDSPAMRQNVGAESDRSLGGFAGNVIKSGYNVAKGVAGAVMHPIDTASGLVDVGAGALQNALPKGVVDFVNKFDSNPDAAKRAVAAADAVGGVYKEKYGGLDKIKKTLYEDPVGAAADLSALLSGGAALVRGAPVVAAGALKVAGAPEMAATVARAAPVAAEIAAPAAEVGRAINPMNAVPLGFAGKMVAKGGNFLANAVNPKAAALVASAEGRGPEIINALRTYEPATPGYAPTAGEATAGLNLTRYPALQQEVSAIKEAATPYYRRGKEQDAALMHPITIEPTAIDMSKAQRTGVTAPMYEAATAPGKVADVSKVSSHIDSVLERNPGNTALVNEFNVIKKGLTDESGALRTDAQQISSTVDNIKAALKDEKNSFIKGELNKAKDMLVEAIPGYTEAQKQFAKLSKPINQMEVADFLKTKLGSALENENKLTPASYANALANAPSTIKRATGLPSYEKLTEIITPEQMKVLDGIKSDIANRAEFERQAAAGSSGGKTIPAGAIPTAPHFLSKVVTVANTIINKLQGRIDRKVATELAIEMLNPETAALSLEQALARQKGIAKVGEDINAAGGVVKNVLRSQTALGAGQVNNALAR
jgi:hypothetical protein